MSLVKTIGIVILFSSSFCISTAQTADYLEKLEHVFEKHEHKSSYGHYINNAENPVEFIFAGLFVTYKMLLSSQDMGTCVFSPSCSVYGIQSIQKKGLIVGTINTFDRLTRCHAFSAKNYIFDPKKNKLYDPVD